MSAHSMLVSELLTYLSDVIGSSLLKMCLNLKLFRCFYPLTLQLLSFYRPEVEFCFCLLCSARCLDGLISCF